jgi:hypothetical protein
MITPMKQTTHEDKLRHRAIRLGLALVKTRAHTKLPQYSLIRSEVLATYSSQEQADDDFWER